MKRFIRPIIITVIVLLLYYFFIQKREVIVNEDSPLDQINETQDSQSSEVTDEIIVEPKPDEAMMVEVMGKMDQKTVVDFMEEKELIKRTPAVVMDDPMPKPEVVDKQKTPAPSPPQPAGPQILAQGTFQNGLYNVSGKAVLIENNGKKTVRFEDFETPNGPQLVVYLATDKSASDYLEIGALKGTKGNINQPIPDTVDTDKYNHVLIWCKPFAVLFGYAVLK